MIKTFKYTAIAEGISYLLFAVTMPLKYQLDILWPNMIVGYAHGFLFVLYFVLLLLTAKKLKFSFVHFVLGFMASLIPLATFFVESKILRKYES
ncbi:MAG: DUF3817 domain-containing protein [Cyclobacteriaceae bacterium]